MTGLVWDKVEDRPYHSGIDRGVLYLADGSGIPWNGLVSVAEEFSSGSEPFYIDGIKYFDYLEKDDFAAALQAFTFPREFLEYDGYAFVGEGLLIGDQAPKQFGLCYRSMVGAQDYQIHIVWNLTAVPDTLTRSTITDKTDASLFGWRLKTVPENVPGFRPTAHVILDSRYMKPALLRDLENILYGSDEGIGIIDGGDMAFWDDLTYDPNALDGGSPGDPGEGMVDGGTSEASIGEIINGNEYFVPVELEMIDGGAPAFAGLEVLDGGNPLSPSPGTDPQLPSLAALVDYVQQWALIYIYDNGDGTWSAIGPPDNVHMIDSETFEIVDANATYLDPDRYELSNTV